VAGDCPLRTAVGIGAIPGGGEAIKMKSVAGVGVRVGVRVMVGVKVGVLLG
jgi:hypothetical protein